MCSLFIFDCISLDISSIFPCVLIRYWREISCRTKIQLLFYYCFVTIQILKAGDFHVTILIEKQPLYDTFSSPPLQRRRRCIWAKSSKFLPLVMILCLALSCAIQSTANRIGKQYWILRFRALSTHKTRKRSIFLSMPKHPTRCLCWGRFQYSLQHWTHS